MGRGRAKAKQTRVARKLKYSSPDTDFASLQKELTSGLHIGDEGHCEYIDNEESHQT